jgi:hypothetical protein
MTNMNDDPQLTTPEPEEMRPEPVADQRPAGPDIAPLPEADATEPTWRYQPADAPPQDARKPELERENPAKEVGDWHDPQLSQDETKPAARPSDNTVAEPTAPPPRPVADEVQEEEKAVRAEPVEAEVASARRASTRSAEQHRQAVQDLHQLMVDISKENLELHRRSVEAIRDLTADMMKLKRRLTRLATAKG